MFLLTVPPCITKCYFGQTGVYVTKRLLVIFNSLRLLPMLPKCIACQMSCLIARLKNCDGEPVLADRNSMSIKWNLDLRKWENVNMLNRPFFTLKLHLTKPVYRIPHNCDGKCQWCDCYTILRRCGGLISYRRSSVAHLIRVHLELKCRNRSQCPIRQNKKFELFCRFFNI
jgi:hypothetical protein